MGARAINNYRPTENWTPGKPAFTEVDEKPNGLIDNHSNREWLASEMRRWNEYQSNLYDRRLKNWESDRPPRFAANVALRNRHQRMKPQSPFQFKIPESFSTTQPENPVKPVKPSFGYSGWGIAPKPTDNPIQ